ncbi:hypothetical protein N7447_003582 [Penicillium robsamsonii]|uniref:uncharacterized protein n=1 Tax=Penicillium robsamsonii TaxID=1792511 RepID=UPI002548D676|nr:uncharacterized protein N7447_003582 [Penicillium robsamsonii]KAJ5826819.1 hypothetical protein N7447_003582 [Penicillium robsamsonii]
MLLDPGQKPGLFTNAYMSRTCDWDSAFSGYDAAVDWPAAEFWEELAAEYPDAKVILTIRDPESWYTSVSKTIQDWPMRPDLEWPEQMRKGQQMAAAIIRDGVLRGFDDKAAKITQFKEHIKRVKRTIPAHRLLVMDPTEGWEPLCEFLGVPSPVEIPYPHSNRGTDFEARLLWIRQQIMHNKQDRIKR